MADSKISALTDGTTPATTDAFPAARSGGTTVKLTWAEILAANKAITLDAFAAPAASVAMNSHKLTGLAAGSGVGDSLRYEQLFTAGAVPIADIADPGAGKVIGSSSGAAAVFPPGYEIGYDQITSAVTITSTTESSGTTVISCAAHTFDGAPVMFEFSSYLSISSTGTGSCLLSLFEGATELGVFAQLFTTVTATANFSIVGRFRFTPSAGSHTYTISGNKSGSTVTPQVLAGAGGTGTQMPAFARFTKV